ncbi:hypothetical protein GCM10009760_05300 [Kitasatospora kazusensis]|uniref:ABC3 transporter permease C-terminal domain-containing protein n=1 Tax=Kitasatospora kazusensis TaxID=407974 RepID=A0ABN2YRW0_9ACTN
MRPGAWRVALRIARRDAMRAKGRSALVLAMIALPVLGVAGADVVYRSAQLTPSEQAARQLGRADAVVSQYDQGSTVKQAPNSGDGYNSENPKKGDKPTPEQLRSLATDPAVLVRQLLPAGSTLLPLTQGSGAATTTRDGLVRVQTAEADLANPVWHGRINLIRGRAPGSPQELAATQHFLDLAHLKVGDTTTLRGLDSRPFTITAAVEDPSDLKNDQLIGRPGELLDPLDKALGQSADRSPSFGRSKWFLQLPAGTVLDWPKVLELNKYGFLADSRSVLLDPPPRSAVPYFVEQDASGGSGSLIDSTAVVVLATVCGMALLEIVLLAGPAFAVGARRSRRQLGLLAAGGGDRAHVRAVVLGGGVVLGLAGAVTGVVLGIALVAVVRPWAEEASGSRFGHFAVQPLDLLAVAGIGLVTGLLAAVVPAFQAARQDVVEALTGRGTIRPASRKLAVLGLLMLLGGGALALFGGTIGGLRSHRSVAVLGGSMIAELGMVACTPILVGLFGRLGRLLPLSPRLALRDSVRHRGRTAPAVAAVMAAVAGSVAVGIYGASSDQEMRGHYTAGLPSGGVAVALGWGREADPKLLPQQRAAIEQAMPGLGARGDISAISYPAGCSPLAGSCGYVQLSIPKERRCPATDQDRTESLNGADFQRLMRTDPRCANGYPSSQQFGTLTAGDATVLHNLLGVQDPAAVRALTEGKLVVFDPVYLKDGKVTLKLAEPSNDRGVPVIGADGAVAEPAKTRSHDVAVPAVLATAQVRSATALITVPAVRALGLGTTEAGSVWLPESAPSDTAEQKATAAVSKVDAGARLTVERGFRPQHGAISLALTGFAALVALGAAGIATGLAAADSQRDLATLAAVGAGGGIRRRLSGFQCGVIAAMGAVLGTVSGMVPAVALRKVQAMAASADPYADAGAGHAVIAFPWLNIAATLVVLPAVAVLLAMLFTRSRLVLLRRAG